MNLIAHDYGFTHWPMLMKHFNAVRLNNTESIWRSFYPGVMMLLTATEGVGKVFMALNLVCIALQEDVSVAYVAINNNCKLIHERFRIILGDAAENFQCSGDFKILDIASEERLFDKVKSINNNTLIIIDHLQDINISYEKAKDHEALLFALKDVAINKSSRILMLGQATSKGALVACEKVKIYLDIFLIICIWILLKMIRVIDES